MQTVFWNRRSGRDRRREAVPELYLQGDERRVMDRRLYDDNGYMLVVGESGLDRFTILVTVPAMVFVFGALLLSSLVTF